MISFINYSKYKRPLSIAIGIFLIGVLFKIQHWKYGAEITTLGYSGIALFVTLHVLTKPTKKLIDLVLLLVVWLWVVLGILRLYHLPYPALMGHFFIGLAILWGVLAVLQAITDKSLKQTFTKNKYVYVVFGIAAFCIVAGSFFRILHWPGATWLLVVGFVSVAVWFIFGRK